MVFLSHWWTGKWGIKRLYLAANYSVQPVSGPFNQNWKYTDVCRVKWFLVNLTNGSIFITFTCSENTSTSSLSILLRINLSRIVEHLAMKASRLNKEYKIFCEGFPAIRTRRHFIFVIFRFICRRPHFSTLHRKGSQKVIKCFKTFLKGKNCAKWPCECMLLLT